MINANVIFQTPSHYKALLPTRLPLYETTIDIEELLDILIENHDTLPVLEGYLVVMKGEDIFSDDDGTTIINFGKARFSFSKKPHLFPTSPNSRFGVTLHYKGKEYHVAYNEENNLAIGYKNVLYQIENETINEDCLEIFSTVFLGAEINEFIPV